VYTRVGYIDKIGRFGVVLGNLYATHAGIGNSNGNPWMRTVTGHSEISTMHAVIKDSLEIPGCLQYYNIRRSSHGFSVPLLIIQSFASMNFSLYKLTLSLNCTLIYTSNFNLQSFK